MNSKCEVTLLISHDIHFLKVDRSPVTYTIANHVNEGIGDCNHPYPFVLEDILDEEGLERNLVLLPLLGLHT